MFYHCGFPAAPVADYHREKAITSFWCHFYWNDNPWILTTRGKPLRSSQFARILPCRIRDLCIHRTGPHKFTFTIPSLVDEAPSHMHPKLRRWASLILLASPHIAIGAALTEPPLLLRQPPPFQQQYRWTRVSATSIVGTAPGFTSSPAQTVRLSKGVDGLLWFVHGDPPDLRTSTEREAADWLHRLKRGLVFLAHPDIHRLPWSVPDRVQNHRVASSFLQQAFHYHKRMMRPALQHWLNRFEHQTRSERWLAAVADQSPAQIWRHADSLSEYQVWTGYRIATNQLNLYHAGRSDDPSCRKLEHCRGRKETVTHLFWDCSNAMACWRLLLCHWSGEGVQESAVSGHFRYFAHRRAPPLPPRLLQLLIDRFGDDHTAAADEYRRIWFVLCSLCQVHLWVERNGVIFRGKSTSPAQSALAFWRSGLRQLKAIALREHRSAATAVRGARLHACLDILSQVPTGRQASQTISHDELTDPALVSWFRIFQTSCTY